jgi:hypothetical protein
MSLWILEEGMKDEPEGKEGNGPQILPGDTCKLQIRPARRACRQLVVLAGASKRKERKF